MKRMMAIGFSLVFGLAAHAAWADGFVDMSTLPDGTGYFIFANQDNGGWLSSGGPNFTSPTATTQGALWIKTGSAAPVWMDQDVNMSLYWRPNSTSAWTQMTTILLNDATDPVGATTYDLPSADLDVTGLAYPGYFTDFSGASWSGQGPLNGKNQRPAHSNYQLSCEEYYLPGSTGLDFTQFQFDVQAWTGNFNSFSAATAGGQYVADSGAFLANSGSNPYDSFPGIALLGNNDITPPSVGGAFFNMPALVMKQSVSGDANLDGKVDINDLTIVLAHYGQTGTTWAQGEFTGDGTVDINDLTIVLAHYGQTAGASVGGMAAVPEPSTLALIGVAAIGLFGFVWRRRKHGGRKTDYDTDR